MSQLPKYNKKVKTEGQMEMPFVRTVSCQQTPFKHRFENKEK